MPLLKGLDHRNSEIKGMSTVPVSKTRCISLKGQGIMFTYEAQGSKTPLSCQAVRGAREQNLRSQT